MHVPPRFFPSARRPGAGFTLVELMVAMLIASMALWLSYNLFDTTRLGVRMGLERSEMFQAAYQAETRLRQDMGSLIGPKKTANEAAGALLIIPAMRAGTLPKPGNSGLQQTLTKLRSDQLVIFYDAKHGGLIRDTGTGETLRSLTVTGGSGTQARLWYGHVQRADGEPANAVDWTVGRQAALLVDPDSDVVTTPATLDATGILSPASAAGAISDVFPHGLEEVANWMRVPGRTDAQMITAFAVAPNSNTAYTNQPMVEVEPLRDNVLDTTDVFSGHRIFLTHCSEVVVQYAGDLDFNGMTDTNGTSDYKGEIKWYPADSDVFNDAAAGHAAAMTAKVFYPADDQVRVWHLGYYQGPDPSRYNTNRRADVTPYPAVGGLKFGDAIPNDLTDVDPADGIPDNPRASYDAAMAAYANHHNGFRPSRVIPPRQSLWPRMIRIRLRLHDARGRVSGINDDFATNKRDDDGDGTVDNPSEVRSCGVWFEYVFAMPCPRTS